MGTGNKERDVRRSLRVLIALAVGMGIAALAIIVALWMNAGQQMGSVAAQDDSAVLADKESSTPKLTNPTTQVIDLVSLMGLSQGRAVAQIGHGAQVGDQGTLSSLGFSNEVSVVLTDEKGDTLSGTPTVTLGLDAEGNVAAASYEAPTSLLGYGELSFRSAVQDYHIIERMLGKVGIVGVTEGSVKLPKQDDYSYYESDRVTLSAEKYTFKGTATVGSQVYSWEATLNYDYTEANKTGDLANTVKKLTVAIMPG